MGRRKIEIKFINDDRNRSVTFIKRKNGLFKKAHELSILTGAKVTVHVEDIKERQFDYISANLGGESSMIAQFQSDDDEDDTHSLDGLEDTHETDVHESASSVGSVSGLGSKRDSGVIRGGHRRSQSSIHLSPNPGVPPASRRVSGHPYPRSPNSVPVSSNNLSRPASMDFGMAGYGTQAQPAGGPQRKYSNPTMSHNQYQQFQHPQANQQYLPPQGQGSTSNQFYFHPNQSHPAFTTPESHASYAQNQQQMPRYNGSLFQTNGHPATNSQQHLPAYPSNLAPNSHRQHNSTLPGAKAGNEYVDYVGGLEEYMDDELEHDFDPLGTQASTPGNYDFSTNPSLTNLNTSLQGHTANQQQGRNTNLGLGIAQQGGYPAYMNVPSQYVPSQHSNMHQQPQTQQQQQQQHQQRQFYNNPSGAQSTPNLAWTLASQQTSPAHR